MDGPHVIIEQRDAIDAGPGLVGEPGLELMPVAGIVHPADRPLLLARGHPWIILALWSEVDPPLLDVLFKSVP